MTLSRTMLSNFTNPPSEYRGKPFWAWNGKLEPEELRRQIRIMKKMGFGGFFMHSRVGLETPYLSKEWFECVRECIDEAEKQNMEAWLYDEDRWPSGFAGGLVTRNPDYRMRTLRIDLVDNRSGILSDPDILAVFAAVIKGNTATGVRRVTGRAKRGALKHGECLVVFRCQISQCYSTYNGYSYLDILNPAAVREFIRITHEAYKKEIGDKFGKRVPGIFTDEPNFPAMGWDGGSRYAWTESLPRTFKKRYGYDLVARLMEVFFDVEGAAVSQPRYHYLDCVTTLFVDSFSRQIGAWCEKNKIAFTGHCLAEETLSSQTNCVGSAMRFYEFQQAPGMDILTQYSREYDTAKQVASVARQFGRKWRLSETYGCTGWDFPFAGHKAVGDWQTALGINLRCHHLAWYTMEGEAKRDYPAAIFYQSPWWEYYRHVEDYYSRCHSVLTAGADVRDVLVIHPVESMWLKVKYRWKGGVDGAFLNRLIRDLRDTLLGANLDFDYGEEEILSRHGRAVRRGSDVFLVVNKARYKAVVVPPMVTIRSTTLRLLTAFAEAGGSVVFAGAPPPCVDALASTAPAELARRCLSAPASGKKLAAAIPAACRRISVADVHGGEINGTLHLLTESASSYQLFICNTGHPFKNMPADGLGDQHIDKRTMALDKIVVGGFADCEGAPLEFDAETGAIFTADARRGREGSWTIKTSLPPLGSRLFVVAKKKGGREFPRRRNLVAVRSSALVRRKWNVSLSDENVLVLDRPAYSIGGGRERGPKEILRIDNEVREGLGLPPRGGEMVQPWAREKIACPPAARVKLKYVFEVKVPPSGRLFIGLEQPGRYVIALNGTVLDTTTECGWWTDRSLRTIAFDPSLLCLGNNELVLECRYDANGAGLEIVYLLGNFGVKTSGTTVSMGAVPTTLAIGDWCKQGLAFYGGSVGYTTTIQPRIARGERLFVGVPEFSGTAVRILVDAKQAGIIAWEPHDLDITDQVKNKKKCELCIEVIGHRRNSHGPLHLSDPFPHWTGPAEFKTEKERWTDGYNLVAVGLMKDPRLIIKSMA